MMQDWDEQDWRDHYEERAAIIEYDGKRPRQAAELAAQVEVRRLRMQALAIGAATAPHTRSAALGGKVVDIILDEAKWAYREATGREW